MPSIETTPTEEPEDTEDPDTGAVDTPSDKFTVRGTAIQITHGVLQANVRHPTVETHQPTPDRTGDSLLIVSLLDNDEDVLLELGHTWDNQRASVLAHLSPSQSDTLADHLDHSTDPDASTSRLNPIPLDRATGSVTTHNGSLSTATHHGYLTLADSVEPIKLTLRFDVDHHPDDHMSALAMLSPQRARDIATALREVADSLS